MIRDLLVLALVVTLAVVVGAWVMKHPPDIATIVPTTTTSVMP